MLKFTASYGSVKKVSGTEYWIVSDPFVWWLDYEDRKECIVVEEGFRTNFWSVPKALWWLFNPTEWNWFVMHDWIYANKMAYNPFLDEYRPLSRKECDQILYEALLVEWEKKWKARLIYCGVRILWFYYYY